MARLNSDFKKMRERHFGEISATIAAFSKVGPLLAIVIPLVFGGISDITNWQIYLALSIYFLSRMAKDEIEEWF